MPYALVTGAAKGIGLAIAHELAKRKYSLILVDIDADQLYTAAKILEKKYAVEVLPLHADLSAEDAVENIFSFTGAYHHELRVVVNNAGYGLNGAFEKIPLHDQLNIIDVNIKALVKLSHAYIPVLKKHAKSYLLNVSSTTAYQTVPYLNIYAATKAFVLSFTRGLKHELADTTISVSALSPGSTDTDFVNRAGMSEATKKIAARYNMAPKQVAEIAVSGLFAGKTEIVPGFTNKLNAFLPKFFAKGFVEKIALKIYKNNYSKATGTTTILQLQKEILNSQ